MSLNKQQGGKWITATATGSSSATATITGIAGTTFFVTDISGSSDLTGATIKLSDGSTVIWQDRCSNTSGYVVSFVQPLTIGTGDTVTLVVTGTSLCNANISGFSIAAP